MTATSAVTTSGPLRHRMLANSCLMTTDHVSQTFLLADPFWIRKITTDPHILAHVNTDCPDDGYPKSKMCSSELISYSCEYIPAVYVIM